MTHHSKLSKHFYLSTYKCKHVEVFTKERKHKCLKSELNKEKFNEKKF